MYFIYVDEAGISRPEPVTIVAAVLLQADRHWMEAKRLVESSYDRHVPSRLRDSFVFHATDVRSGYRDYDDTWSEQDRFAFIAEMASIPRMLRAAVAFGKVRRDSFAPEGVRIKPEDFHHWAAFHRCLLRADKYIQDFGKTNEVAIVIAEDVPKYKELFQRLKQITMLPLPLTAEFVALTTEEVEYGAINPTRATHVERIVDTIHFVKKKDSPLLPIADACAFSFRRWLSGASYGDKLTCSMLGNSLIWEDWQGPSSNMVFSFDPSKRYSSPARPIYRL